MDRNTTDMQAIIAKAKDGDKDAFGVLYQEFYTPVYRYIYFRVSSKDEAEELAQDVFVKAMNAFTRYEARTNTPLPYFYTIARNTVIDWQKKKRGVHVDQEMFMEIADDTSKTDKQAVVSEELVALKKALQELPEDQREALELRFFNDLSGREVAQVMGKSEESVRQLQSRGMKALKSHFQTAYGTV